MLPDRHTRRRFLMGVGIAMSGVAIEAGWNPNLKPYAYDPNAAIELLQSLRTGDADEQRATLEYLMQALDEGRSEGLKIFPEK